jgi:hypothetical protein
MSRARLLAGVHAGYLIGTGTWGAAHRASFERVTGPKQDYWLVRIVGALVALGGVTLAIPVLRGRRSAESRAVAAGMAVVFSAADVWAGKHKSRVYFADLVPQAVFTPAWFLPWREGG